MFGHLCYKTRLRQPPNEISAGKAADIRYYILYIII